MTLVDLEAEQRVLAGLMFASPKAVVEPLARLKDSWFADSGHRLIFVAIRQTLADGLRPDVPTVTDRLERAGDLGHVGGTIDGQRLSGAAYMAWLGKTLPFVGNLSGYVDRVADLARRRSVKAVAEQVSKACDDPSVDMALVTADAAQSLVVDDTPGVLTVFDVGDDVRELHQGGLSRGVSSGWSSVDRIYLPVPGQVTVVAGVRSHGKSAFTDALCVNLAKKHGWRTAIWSPEGAPTADHISRLAAIYDGSRFEDIPAERLESVLAWLHEHFVFIDHDAHDTVISILAQVAAQHARRTLHNFVIDPWTDVNQRRPSHVREDEQINAHLTTIRNFARRHDMHAAVVVHPKQMERDKSGVMPVPTDSTLAGGSIWGRKTDALVVVWRDDTSDDGHTSVYAQKIKRNKRDGHMGRMTQLRFDVDTGRYSPLVQAVNDRMVP